MDASGSPKSARQRLVVASQSLEIQHLQDLVRNREREMHDASRKSSAEADDARNQIISLTQKNLRLDSQVQLLADKLREMETSRDSSAIGDLDSVRSMALSGQERDKTLQQLRDELRKARNEVVSLVEEREILLEKLIWERSTKADLENRFAAAASNPKHHRHPVDGSKLVANLKSDAAVQTGAAGSILDSGISLSGKAGIELLREHIELEQELVNYHQDLTAHHGANVAEMHERLKQCLQGEVRKLQEEQERYGRMIQSVSSTKANNAPPQHAATIAPYPSLQFGWATPVQAAAAPVRSPIPSTASPSTSFFHQQEQEMFNLKRRLHDLHVRHDELSGGAPHFVSPPPNPQQTTRAVVAQAPAADSSGGHNRSAASSVHNSAILQRMLASASRH